MSLGPIAMDEACNGMQKVLVKCVEKYDLTPEESCDIADTFAEGWRIIVLLSTEPDQHPELEKYVVRDSDVSIDIPDNLEGLE